MAGQQKAKRFIPGGVSSPARAFGAVGGDPIHAARGDGAYLIDNDRNRYIDYIQGFGAVILGHTNTRVMWATKEAVSNGGAVGLTTDAEVRLAELVCQRVPSVERVRFVTSGTEASMTAARLARAVTGRSVIVTFEGCYHGHADPFLAKAGSGVATFGVPNAAGVPEASVRDTVVVPYNDVAALRAALQQHEVAAVFVEPVAANMGVVRPAEGFLEAIVEGCRAAGALSVFDEVVTGFRLGPGGAQERFGLTPDLTMLGKVLGGGLPVGALGGRADLMEQLAPLGPVYQAGTYAAHPHAMAAGAAVLESLTPEDYTALEATATRLADGLAGLPGITVQRVGTILSVFFAFQPPSDFAAVEATDKEAFSRLHQHIRGQGVLIPPSPFEAWFPSLAHSESDIDKTVEAMREALGG